MIWFVPRLSLHRHVRSTDTLLSRFSFKLRVAKQPSGGIVMMQPRLKHFGWGREGEGLTPAEEAFVLQRFEQRFGPPADDEIKPPRLEDIKLETPRLDPPASLPFCSTALYDRAAHTYGKSFPDYVRGLVGDYSCAPDVVAYPHNEEEVAAALDWAGGAQASVTPFEIGRASCRERV